MLVKNGFAKELDWNEELRLSKLPSPAYSTPLGAMFHLDALELLRTLPSNSIDLVMTSPPFALTRKKEYGNEPIERYIGWLMPFCLEIKRVLKPRGSFVLDIGGSWVAGAPVRSTYHFALAVKLAEEFKLAQEFYHYNPARLPSPAEWVTVQRWRVKDAVNMVWWFGKTEHPKADNRKILQPYSESMKSLLKQGYVAKKRPSGHHISEKFSKDNGGAIPSNLIQIADLSEAELARLNEIAGIPPNLIQIANTESNSYYLRACRERGIKPHPARYPESLVKFFLDFLTDEGDLVYDSFAGSNVTGAACESNNRRWLATEVEKEYIEGSMFRFEMPLVDGKTQEKGDRDRPEQRTMPWSQSG